MESSLPDPENYFLINRKLSVMNEDDKNLMWRGLQLSRGKLKAVGQTSGLLSGFAVVAIVELDIRETAPTYLKIPFVVCACILVAVHMIALMIATCILPHLELYSSYRGPNILESPHKKLRKYIEVAWICSTAIGILLFLVVVDLAFWLKFYDTPVIPIIATSILAPVIILFIVFAAVFYDSLIGHQFRHTAQIVTDLDVIAKNLQRNSMNDESLDTGIPLVPTMGASGDVPSQSNNDDELQYITTVPS